MTVGTEGGAVRTLVCSLAVALLAACGSSPPAPVEDRNATASRPAAAAPQVLNERETYLVSRGDTLYSIAFRYGFDYRGLAAANAIAPPYRIYPGQRLVLREAAIPAKATKAAPVHSVPPPKTTVTKPLTTSATKEAVAKIPAAPPKPVASGPVSAWRWPTEGPVIRNFSTTVHKGIDIGGKRGDPVVAVAAGQVVYAGTGIVGLGRLLIVKHNERYLSAYGHNDALLVGEGDAVRAGQLIARKGSSGTDGVKLHFEIRREGRPVDPLSILPRR